jgi:hypothetical protein
LYFCLTLTLVPRSRHLVVIGDLGPDLPRAVTRHFRSQDLLHHIEQTIIGPQITERLREKKNGGTYVYVLI